MGKGGYHGGSTIIQTGKLGPLSKKAPSRLGVTSGHITERRAKMKMERREKRAAEKKLYRQNMKALGEVSKMYVENHRKPAAGAILALALQAALDRKTDP